MGLVPEIVKLERQMTEWRRDLHAHPETAFEEVRTSEFVAGRLKAYGYDVDCGLGKTGVVGTIQAGTSARRIGLRADMDALHIHELNDLDYRSTVDGKMHACGHDGHTSMLLGAAKVLADTRRFDGTVRVIFQPAEENEGGGRAMIEDGLFDRFPVDAVYGMHNKPGVPIGEFGIRNGPMLASYDIFEITIHGEPTHAALPYTGRDAVAVAGHLIQGLQNLVRLSVHPVDSAVVSVTQLHGGDTWNVLPAEVVLRGTTRCYKREVQDRLEDAMERLTKGSAQSFGVEIDFRYERRYPPTVNHPRETAIAAEVAADIVTEQNVDLDIMPAMGAEDFAFMLEKKPGAYIYVGNGESSDGCYLHNSRYNFNDDALVYGGSYWVRLVETQLAV